MASEAVEATFSHRENSQKNTRTRIRMPGILSGDIGPKGEVSAQHRDLSRTQRRRLGDVPQGGVAPNSALILLAPMLFIVVLLLALAALLGWLLT